MTLDVDGETPLTKKDLVDRHWSSGQGARAQRFGGWNTNAVELHHDVCEDSFDKCAAATKSTARVDASAAGSNNGTVGGAQILIHLQVKNDNEYFSKRVLRSSTELKSNLRSPV